MKIYTATVTPAQARAMLGKNDGNRPLRTNLVKRLAEAIRKGDWMLTHQPIAFAGDGTLLDGQHRLTAIAMAGIPAPMTIATGCDPATFAAIDIGARRSNTDVLNDIHKMSVTTVTAIARIHMSNAQPTPADVLRYMDAFRSWADMVTAAQTRKSATFTASNLRAVVTVRAAMGQADYVVPLYAALGRTDFDSLPRIGRSLLARAIKRDFPPAGSYDFTAFWWHCTDPQNRDLVKPYVKLVENHIGAMRTAIEGLVNDAVPVAAE